MIRRMAESLERRARRPENDNGRPKAPAVNVSRRTGTRYCLEQVDHAKHEALRLATDGDRIRVDVERVRRLTAVVDLHVACIHLRALAERVRVADLVLLRLGVVALRETGDARAIRSAALAVLCLAVERIPRSRTHRHRGAETPQIALQVARRRVVLQVIVDSRNANDAEVVATGDADRRVVEVLTANLLVTFDPRTDLDRAVV